MQSRYGNLTVISPAPPQGGRPFILCRCDCGVVRAFNKSKVVTGKAKSCGCSHASAVSTHSMTGTPTWNSWMRMRDRCLRATDRAFPGYGGRGITICESWAESFESFLSDMGERPHGTTLDRIDVEGGYCRENCRWADPKQQGNNKRNNRMITACGRTQTIAQWSEETGIKWTTIWMRIASGWSDEKSVTTPTRAQSVRT